MSTSKKRNTKIINPYADPEFRERVRVSARFLNAIRWNRYVVSTKLRDDVPYVADARCQTCGKPLYPVGWACPIQGSGEPSVVLHCPDCMCFTSYPENDPQWWIVRESTVWSECFAKRWQDARRLLLEAGDKMQERDYAGAVPLLLKSYKHDPFNAVTSYTLAAAFEGLEEVEKALRYYARACELDRSVMDYRLRHGEALLRAGKPVRAQKVFSEAVEMRLRERFNWSFDKDPRAQSPDPELVRAYLGLGLSFERQKQWQRARDTYLKATEEDANHPYAFWYLGGAYHGLGEPEAAAEALEEAVRNQPDRAEIHYELGNEYLASNEPDLAATCFKDALRINPDFSPAQLNLAYAFDEMGKMSEAIMLYEHLIEHHEDCIPAYSALGSALHRTGHSEEGLVWMRRAIEMAPDIPIAYEGLGEILVSLNRSEEAIIPLRKAWRELQWVGAGYWLGKALRYLGKLKRAEEILLEVILKQPFFPNAYFELGMVHASAGQKQLAMECFRKTISQSPGHTDAMLEFGLLLIKDCDDEKAKRIIATLEHLDKTKANILRGRLEGAIQQEVDRVIDAEQ